MILLVLLLVMILTYFMPSGKYASLQYNTQSNNFTITNPTGRESTAPGTQATLKKYHVNTSLAKFKDGSVYKPVAIPNTYQHLKKANTGLFWCG